MECVYYNVQASQIGTGLIGIPEEFKDFTSLFKKDYNSMVKSGKIEKGVTLEDYLSSLKTLGEYDHKMDKPFLAFVSGVLDITIIKPVIEAFTGYEMITKEDLSDTERGMKVLFAAVDLIPIAKGIRLIGEQGVKETLKLAGKAALVEIASNGSGYMVGSLGEELGLPAPITLLLSGATGMSVAIVGTKVVFKNAAGEVLESIEGGSGSIFARNDLQSVLKKEGIKLDEFNTLRLTDVNKLSPEQALKLKNIREAVPAIDSTTVVQKTIPFEDIEKYIGDDGYDSIGGYIARYDDVAHISGYDNVIESLRLGYVKADGIRPYPEGGDKYGYIKFKSNDTDKIGITYGEQLGATNIDGAPCTLNGFTGARNGEIIPEWTVNGYMKAKVGGELHKVIGSEDSIIAILDGKHFREVSK